jgi:capsular exopolysaccharide synthesis family protein
MAEETIRTLRAGLSFLGDKQERQSFLFTSAVPAEGKSWVSSNLAVAFALQEEKTLVIDFDLRKPVQHTIFQVEKDHPGVTDYLSQGKTLEEVLQKPEAAPDDLFLISAGSSTPNPAELLTSRNVERIINDASACFDRIILDTPPVLSVRDALVLAKLAQSVVLVFRTGKTHAGALTRALGLLEANQTTPVGIAANCLRGKSANTYGYYYSYGNKSYERYYAKNEM